MKWTEEMKRVDEMNRRNEKSWGNEKKKWKELMKWKEEMRGIAVTTNNPGRYTYIFKQNPLSQLTLGEIFI